MLEPTGQSAPLHAAPVASFFRSLYDLSFNEFVTPKIIRVIYVITLVIAGLWCAGMLLGGLAGLGALSQMSNSYGYTPGYAGLFLFLPTVGAPILFVLISLAARINLEFLIAVFRIAENTDSLRQR